MRLPFWQLFIFLLGFKFLFDLLSFLHQLFLVVVDDAVLLGIELFPFFLEHFFANDLMLCETVRIKLATATLSAQLQLGWIVLDNIDLILSVHLFDAPLLSIILVIVCSVPRVTVVVVVLLLFLGSSVRIRSPSAGRILSDSGFARV